MYEKMVMWAGDDEQMINYEWPRSQLPVLSFVNILHLLLHQQI